MRCENCGEETTRPFCDNCKIAKLGLEVEKEKKKNSALKKFIYVIVVLAIAGMIGIYFI